MRILAVIGLAIGLGIPLSAQKDAELPAAAGGDLVRSRCLTCHGADLIQQQRLARPGWTGELNKMVKWGAVLSPQEFELAANYLSTSFSATAAPTTPGEVGAAAFQRRCVACHEPDIVGQQRLVRAAWAREIDKMIRWGAGVTDEEREPLIDYLVGFAPTQRGAPAR